MIFGDPCKIPHPVRIIGRFIGFLEGKLKVDDLGDEADKRNFRRGIVLLIAAVSAPTVCYLGIMLAAYGINVYLGFAVEAFLTYQLIAAGSLKKESMKVYHALEERSGRDELERARYAVSMIVGRDTVSLDEKGIIRAAVETIAENTSDGVTAPIFWYVLFGMLIFGFSVCCT